MKCNQSRPGFEFVLPCSFPTTITITPRAPSRGIRALLIEYTLKSDITFIPAWKLYTLYIFCENQKYQWHVWYSKHNYLALYTDLWVYLSIHFLYPPLIGKSLQNMSKLRLVLSCICWWALEIWRPWNSRSLSSLPSRLDPDVKFLLLSHLCVKLISLKVILIQQNSV